MSYADNGRNEELINQIYAFRATQSLTGDDTHRHLYFGPATAAIRFAADGSGLTIITGTTPVFAARVPPFFRMPSIWL